MIKQILYLALSCLRFVGWWVANAVCRVVRSAWAVRVVLLSAWVAVLGYCAMEYF